MALSAYSEPQSQAPTASSAPAAASSAKASAAAPEKKAEHYNVVVNAGLPPFAFRADYVLGDGAAIAYFLKDYPEADKIQRVAYDDPEKTKASFAAPKGSVELMKKINTGLSNIRKNGTYDKIYAKWFGNDNSMKITD